ncbi:MAG TPA: Xaa-Pro peptidase family protein [Conexibacter sp.]|nr:Xaa-Pro peptidase family protein [Conexibacter sp.]
MTETERSGQLQRAAAAGGVEALVLRLTENVLLATGYYAQVAGTALAVVPAGGPVSLLVPEHEEAEARSVWSGEVRTFRLGRTDGPPARTAIAERLRELARELGVAGGPIGFEGSFESVAPASLAGESCAVAAPTRTLIRETFATDALVDVTERLEALRAVKTAAEVEKLRTVNEIAAIGMRAFKAHAVPGRTEVEIMAAVESAICTGGHGHRGARVVRAYATVCSGPDLADGWQYFRSRTRVVERDEPVMLELGTMADGWWADHTRTVVAGRASAQQRAAYEAVRHAGDAALASAVPGASGGAVDAAARAACAEAGFTQFPHHTGHGVGFSWHESRPQLVPGSKHELASGMVVVAEPGVYERGLLGGFRHEDDAVVGPAGAAPLVTTDFELEL